MSAEPPEAAFPGGNVVIAVPHALVAARPDADRSARAIAAPATP